MVSKKSQFEMSLLAFFLRSHRNSCVNLAEYLTITHTCEGMVKAPRGGGVMAGRGMLGL